MSVETRESVDGHTLSSRGLHTGSSSKPSFYRTIHRSLRCLVNILIDGLALCAVVRQARTQGHNAGSCFGLSYTVYPDLQICWTPQEIISIRPSPVFRY